MPEKHPVLEGLGNEVVRRRMRMKLTQRELAARSRLHVNYLCGIERGDRNPTVLVLNRLAEALEVELWKLLKGAM